MNLTAVFARDVVGASRGVTLAVDRPCAARSGAYLQDVTKALKIGARRASPPRRVSTTGNDRCMISERAGIIKQPHYSHARRASPARRPFINQSERPPRRDDRFRFFEGPRRIPRRLSGLWRSGWAASTASTSP